MVELRATMTKSGVLYIPKEIRESFGRKLRIIPSASAVVMFPEHVDYEDVLKSLEIIKADIEHRLRLSKKRRTRA